MFLIIIYVVEIFSIIQCIYCLYNARMKLNISTITIITALLFEISLANKYMAVLEHSIIMYVFLALYCGMTFRSGIKDTIMSIILLMTISVIAEFISQYVMLQIVQENLMLRTLCADVLVLLFSIFLLPKLEIYKIKELALKNNILFFISLLFALLIAGIILLQMKILGTIKIELFVFSAPAVMLVLLVSKQWATYQDFYEEKEREVQLYKSDKEKFSGFIEKVRIKQHEINNHLMAVNAMHYTKNTYEELVNAKSTYCQKILLENRFNSLILLYNSTLPGYLYDKFSMMESKGAKIECKVSVQNFNTVIPEYYLIEMLGILLDNAIEALVDETEIQIEINESEKEYIYIVRNRYPYTSFEEMLSWFKYEKSTKGNGRGLGLYHLKKICQEWVCEMQCRNVTIDMDNWIEFRIGTGRKE